MQEDDLQALRTAVRPWSILGSPLALPKLPVSRSSCLVGRCQRRRPGQSPQPRPSARHGAFSGASNHEKRAQGRLRFAAQGAGGNVRCSRWQFWARCTPDRASDFDHHHVAVYWRCCPSEGEDLTDPETALNCLQVFALGGLKGEAMRRTAATLWYVGCSPSRLLRRLALLLIVASWRKARQRWCDLLHRSHPASALLSPRSLRRKLCRLLARSAVRR